MPRVGFEPTISAGERPKTYALDRAATGTGYPLHYSLRKYHLIAPFWSTATFSGTKLEHKIRAWCKRTDINREQKRSSRNMTNALIFCVAYIVERDKMTIL